jgi:hypothetical protein
MVILYGGGGRPPAAGSAGGVLAFGGIFIVVSIGIRMKNGEWLRRAGPFEISERYLKWWLAGFCLRYSEAVAS